ncbi:MAG: ATP-binding protein [bacterium]|nr:ATP-binding protein [bacterium]
MAKEISQIVIDISKRTDGGNPFHRASESAFNHFIITDPDAKIVYANPAVARITGYSLEEIIGNRPSLWGGLMGKEFYQEMWNTIKIKKQNFSGEITNRRKNGEEYVSKVIVSPILDEKHKILGYIGTEEDITLHKEIDKLQSDFISVAVHQLQTPLTGINWSLELFKGFEDFANLSDQQKDAIEMLEKSSDHLHDLVSILLNVGRIESGRLTVKPELTNIKEFVDIISEELQGSIKNKEIEFIKDVSDDLPEINLDRKLVRELIANLLSNAIKYSHPKGKVVVKISQEENDIYFLIEDNGLDITKDQQHRIFDKFFRGDNARKEQISGNGLGLYFAKSIVEICGGKIWFETVENKGSKFFFTLPVSGMEERKGDVSVTPMRLNGQV